MRPGNSLGIKGKNLVEAWEKVLATFGYTNYVWNRGKPCPKPIEKVKFGIYADTCIISVKEI